MIQDILIDENCELQMQEGDVKSGAAGEQVVELLLLSAQGEWKMSPLSGWGVERWKNAPKSEIGRLKPQIMEDLARNGLKADISIGNEIDIEIRE